MQSQDAPFGQQICMDAQKDQSSLSFSVAVEDRQNLIVNEHATPSESITQPESAARAYSTVATQVRLDQHSFRLRVSEAYRECGAVYRLTRVELLEAAHILPDSNPRGESWVSNGISLCKPHRAAFESQLMGIRPDLVVEIRKDILEESDGPLLIRGLKEWHSKKQLVIPHSPKLKPRGDFLEERGRKQQTPKQRDSLQL
jgi:putative restriction endonuclease